MTPIDRLRARFPDSECDVTEGFGAHSARVFPVKGKPCVLESPLCVSPDAAVDAVIAAYDAMVEGSARVKELRAGLDELSAEFVAIGHLKHDLHAQLEEARAQLAAEREHRARKNDATVKP